MGYELAKLISCGQGGDWAWRWACLWLVFSSALAVIVWVFGQWV